MLCYNFIIELYYKGQSLLLWLTVFIFGHLIILTRYITSKLFDSKKNQKTEAKEISRGLNPEVWRVKL